MVNSKYDKKNRLQVCSDAMNHVSLSEIKIIYANSSRSKFACNEKMNGKLVSFPNDLFMDKTPNILLMLKIKIDC